MTDKELLELAAKAAGIEHGAYHPKQGLLIPYDDPLRERSNWNPLADDGDALRLAVKLKLLVDCHSQCVMPLSEDIGWIYGNTTEPNHATRRAIVGAAAELGKAMK